MLLPGPHQAVRQRERLHAVFPAHRERLVTLHRLHKALQFQGQRFPPADRIADHPSFCHPPEYLQAFPVGAGTGTGLSVNYNTIDTNIANAGAVKTVTGEGADITVASNFSSAHTVIDVLGYYYPAP